MFPSVRKAERDVGAAATPKPFVQFRKGFGVSAGTPASSVNGPSDHRMVLRFYLEPSSSLASTSRGRTQTDGLDSNHPEPRTLLRSQVDSHLLLDSVGVVGEVSA